MAEEYFSTETSVKQKVYALRIQWWLDDDHDGSIDQDAFDSAREEAKQEILSYVQPRYGATICEAWDSDTRPGLIGAISDWLTLYHSLYGNNAEHPVALRQYEENIARLEKIRTYQTMIPGIAYTTGQTNETTIAQRDSGDETYDYMYDYGQESDILI